MSNKQNKYTNEKNKIMTLINNKKEGMITQSIIDELKIKITEYNKILKVLNSNKANLSNTQYTSTYNESTLMNDIKKYTEEMNKIKKEIQKGMDITDKIIKEKKILELKKEILGCKYLIDKQKQEDMERTKGFMKLEAEIAETELKLNEITETVTSYEMENAGIDYSVKSDTVKLDEINKTAVTEEKKDIQNKYNEVNNNIKKEKTNYDNINKNSNISKNNEKIAKLTTEIKNNESSKAYLSNKINKIKELSKNSSDLTKIGDLQKQLENIKKESFTPIERFNSSEFSTKFTKDVTSMLTYCNEIINNTKNINSIINEQKFNSEVMEGVKKLMSSSIFSSGIAKLAWSFRKGTSGLSNSVVRNIVDKGDIHNGKIDSSILLSTLNSYKDILYDNIKKGFVLNDNNKKELYKTYWKEMNLTDFFNDPQNKDKIDKHLGYQLTHWRTTVSPFTVLEELYNIITQDSLELTNKLDTCKNNITNYSKEMQTTLINMLSYIQTSVDDINNVINSNQQTINDLKIQIINKQAELDKANEMIKNLQAQLSDLQKQLNSKQEELKICEDQLNLAKKNEASALSDYKQSVSKHDVAKKNYDNAVKNYENTKLQYDKIESDYSDLIMKSSEITDEIAQIEIDIAGKNVEKDKADIEKLEKQKAEYEKEQKALKEQSLKLASDYEKLGNQLTQYEQAKNDLEAKLTYTEEEVKLMYDKYTEQSEARKRLETQQSILVKNINNIKQQIADCNKSLNDEIAKKKEAEKAVEEYKKALEAANNDIMTANRIKQELQYQLEYNRRIQYEEENKYNMLDRQNKEIIYNLDAKDKQNKDIIYELNTKNKQNKEMIYDLDTKNRQLEIELEEANKRLQYTLNNPIIQYIESEPTVQYIERIVEKIIYKEREVVKPDISESIINEALNNIKEAENTTYEDNDYQYDESQYYGTQYDEEQYNSSGFTPTVITLMVIMILGIISSVMSSIVLIYYKTKNISITPSLISTCVSAMISVVFGVAFGVVKSKA